MSSPNYATVNHPLSNTIPIGRCVHLVYHIQHSSKTCKSAPCISTCRYLQVGRLLTNTGRARVTKPNPSLVSSPTHQAAMHSKSIPTPRPQTYLPAQMLAYTQTLCGGGGPRALPRTPIEYVIGFLRLQRRPCCAWVLRIAERTRQCKLWFEKWALRPFLHHTVCAPLSGCRNGKRQLLFVCISPEKIGEKRGNEMKMNSDGCIAAVEVHLGPSGLCGEVKIFGSGVRRSRRMMRSVRIGQVDMCPKGCVDMTQTQSCLRSTRQSWPLAVTRVFACLGHVTRFEE